MRWFPLALVVPGVVLASFAAAQNVPAPSAAPDAEQKKTRLEGTIFSLSGEGVRKATVRLQGGSAQPGQPPGSYSETSDAAGKFVFEDVAPGRYTLSAEKAGFVTARYGARSNTSPGTQLTLAAGMELKDLSIKMTPQGVIIGKVLDEDGDPVPTVQVQIVRTMYAAGRKQLVPSGGSNTNDLGEYRIGNLSPGRYYVNAIDRRPAQFGIADRPGRAGVAQEGNVPTYYPNGVDPSSAVPIDVAAGGEIRGIDIRLLRAKVYSVRGKASEAPGGPGTMFVSLVRKVEGDSVAAILGGNSTSQLRPDGSFEFRGVIPGIYTLQTQPQNINGNASSNLTGRIEVTVSDANIDGLVLPLAPAQAITGTVKLEDGDIATLLKSAQNSAGVIGGINSAISVPGRLLLLLSSSEGPTTGASTTQVKEDGTFQFNAVGAGKYTLNAAVMPQGTYLKSARFGGQDVTHAPIDTTAGTGGTLDLVLSSKSADVSGSVQNEKGEPLAGVLVTLWPKTPDASPTGGTRPGFTDQAGGFKIQSLAPGEYYVAAFEDLESGLVQSPDFLGRFTSDASAVTLAEGSHESRDLKVVPSDKIAIEIAKLP